MLVGNGQVSVGILVKESINDGKICCQISLSQRLECIGEIWMVSEMDVLGVSSV